MLDEVQAMLDAGLGEDPGTGGEDETIRD